MRIGIDIDNTITNTLPVLIDYSIWYNKNILKRDAKMNEKGFAPYNLFEWTYDEQIDFCDKYLEDIVSKASLKQNSVEVIKKLKNENNTIYIITARRKPYFNDAYNITKKFLDENNIVYDKIIVECNDKCTFCKDNNIDIMIDDEPQNISAISNNIPVIVFEAIHNEEYIGKNIIRVNEWDEVYDIIKNI